MWKGFIFEVYRDFLKVQTENGKAIPNPGDSFDLYDLAALAYLYKRIKETIAIICRNDAYVKLLYVAATCALHELTVLHTGDQNGKETAGHSCDLSIRNIRRTRRFLDLLSADGTLRLTPVHDSVIRVQFWNRNSGTPASKAD